MPGVLQMEHPMMGTHSLLSLLPNRTLLAPVTHTDPRDPYVTERDATTAPATDNDDSPTPKETAPSEPQGSPPCNS
ncbi:hypothetical protein Tco_0435169 [Tanacetum coccineum]